MVDQGNYDQNPESQDRIATKKAEKRIHDHS